MAITQGWGAVYHRCKRVQCKLRSWGTGYDQIGGKPQEFHITLERTAKGGHGTEDLHITLTPDELRMIQRTVGDVLAAHEPPQG